MGKAVDDLRRVLQRMQQDLEKTPAAAAPESPAVSELAREAIRRLPSQKPEAVAAAAPAIRYGSQPAAIGSWQRALLMAWVALSVSGVFADDMMIVALGLMGIVWVVVRTSVIAAMHLPASGSVDTEDLVLRVTALEKRVAALKNTPSAGISPKVQEDILELKTILKSLFKALEEQPEETKEKNEDDEDY